MLASIPADASPEVAAAISFPRDRAKEDEYEKLAKELERAAEREAANRSSARRARLTVEGARTDHVSGRHRHRWAVGNAALTTAVVVLVEPSRLGDRSPLGALAVLLVSFVLAFSSWQLVHWVTRGEYLEWSEQDR